MARINCKEYSHFVEILVFAFCSLIKVFHYVEVFICTSSELDNVMSDARLRHQRTQCPFFGTKTCHDESHLTPVD